MVSHATVATVLGVAANDGPTSDVHCDLKSKVVNTNLGRECTSARLLLSTPILKQHCGRGAARAF